MNSLSRLREFLAEGSGVFRTGSGFLCQSQCCIVNKRLYRKKRVLNRLLLEIPLGLVVACVVMHSASAQAQTVSQTSPPPNQLPRGGNVAAGQAQISQSGNVMNIDQSTQKAIINWQEFNVGKDATVNFNQPNASAATLNRVLDSNPSQIFGRIIAPGQVILVNPNGAYFAPSASVDVGGLIATTHELADKDFLDGNYQFKRNGATGKIINEGELKAKLDGYIALMAPEVRNQGVIIAERGTVALASGEHIQLDFGTGNKLQGITVTEQDFDAQIENKHAIIAEGGLVILSARATAELRASVIKNSGKIVASAGANTVTQKGGRIILEGNHIQVTEGSELIATGHKGGGEILVGGDWQGGANAERRVFDKPNQIHQATKVVVETNTKIDASATDNGDGGTVVVWSDVTNPDSVTTVQGEIRAMGGVNSGNGGQIETSGSVLTVDGLRVDAGAISGRAGLWLLDPYDYVIDLLEASAISRALETTDVTVTTTVQNTSYGAVQTQGAGNILLNHHIEKLENSQLTTLTLKANRDIDMNGQYVVGRLNLVLWSDSDSVLGGAVANLGGITTGGGFVWVGGGALSSQFEGIDVPTGPTTGTIGAPLTITGSINTFGGDIFIWSGGGTSSNALKFDGTTAVAYSGFLEISTEDANGVFAGDITIRADEFEFSGFPSGQKPKIVTGGGSVAILPAVTGGSFSQSIQTSLFEFEGAFSGMQIGAAGNTADLFIDSVISAPIVGPVSLFGNTVNVNQNITTTGSASASVSIAANTINLGANIIGTGAHVLDGNVVIQGAPGVERTIEGVSVLFGSTVDGTNLHSLSIVGNADFSSDVGAVNPLSILRVYGSTRLEGDVNTTWLQEYRGPLTLVGNRSLSSDTIVFRSSIDGTTLGSDRLQASVQTSLIFDGDVGSSVKPGSLAVSGPATIGGHIATTGALSLAGMTTLADHSILVGSGIGLAAVQLDGKVLTVHESGVGLISGVVSDGIAPGGALTMSGSGVLTITDNGTYTGATTISNGTLIFSNNAPTTNSSGFNGPGKLIIRPVLDDFTDSFSTADWYFGQDLRELTIGRFDKSADGINDADVIIAQAYTLAGEVFIFGANVSVLDDLTVSGSGNLPVSVRLQASGVVSTKGIEAPKSIIINNSVGSEHVFISGSVRAGADFSVLTGGTIFLQGDVTTAGHQLYDAPVVVSGSREISGASISFSAVDGATTGQDDIDITGNVSFSGDVGSIAPLGVLSVSGTTLLGGDITAAGVLRLSSPTTLTSNRTLTGSGISLGAVILDGNTLTVTEGGFGTISGAISDGSASSGGLIKAGQGSLTVTANGTYTGLTTISEGILVLSNDSPQTASRGFAGPGELQITPTSADFTADFSTANWVFAQDLGGLLIGKPSSADGTNDVNVTFANGVSIDGYIAAFGKTISAAQGLTTSGSSIVYLDASDSLSLADVTAGGFIWVQNRGSNPVRVTGTLTSGDDISILTSGEISVAALVATDLITLSNTPGSGDIWMQGSVNTGSLNVRSHGTIVLGGDVTSVRAQDYDGAVVLSGDRALAGAYARFFSTIDGTTAGQEALSITGDGVFVGHVGTTVPLESLSVSGATSLGGDVTTQNAQAYIGLTTVARTLNVGRTLTGHGISLGEINLEGEILTISESGVGTISGIVQDGSLPGGGLTKAGSGGRLTLLVNGSYSGPTTVSGGVLVFSNDAPSTRSSSFSGAGWLVITSTSDDFSGSFSTQGWNFQPDLGRLTIGSFFTGSDGVNDASVVVVDPITVAGRLYIFAGDVTTRDQIIVTGGQAWQGTSEVLIDGSGDVSVSSIISAGDVLLGARGDIQINGALEAGDFLGIDSGQSVFLHEDIIGNQIQFFGDVYFSGTRTVTASTIEFFNNVNAILGGQDSLTVVGDTTLGGEVGGLTPLGGVTVSGDLLLGGNITTTGVQAVTGNTTLNGDRSLTGSGIRLGSIALDGHTLTVNENALGTISGVVSDGTASGGSLIKSGPGTLILQANGSYTGATGVLNGSLVLSSDSPASTSSGFSGPGHLFIQPTSASFQGTFQTSGWIFDQSLGGLAIGKPGNLSEILVDREVTIDGSITLIGREVTLDRFLRVGPHQNIVLAASGGFINNIGASALDARGTGRWVVYMADPAGNVYGGLNSANEAIWNETYETLPPDLVPAGNRYVLAGGAINAVTLTTTDATKVYGESIDLSSHYVLSATGYDGEPGIYLATTGLSSGTLADVFSTDPVFTSIGASPSSGVGQAPITTTPGVVRNGFAVTYSDLGQLTVARRPIVIAAVASQQKFYGEPDPSLTYTAELMNGARGLYGADTFTGMVQRIPGENVGRYEINQGTLDNPNYDISFLSADFTIRPKPIVITAQPKTKIYGESDPELTYIIDVGLVGLDRLTGNLSRVVGEGLGFYAIVQNTLSIDDGVGGSNYTLSFIGARLEIFPDPEMESSRRESIHSLPYVQAEQFSPLLSWAPGGERGLVILDTIDLVGELQPQVVNDAVLALVSYETQEQQPIDLVCQDFSLQAQPTCLSAGVADRAFEGSGVDLVDVFH